jgi:hypothetical protein
MPHAAANTELLEPQAESPAESPDQVLAAYHAHHARTGRGNTAFTYWAKTFLRRWPAVRDWEREPLQVQLGVSRTSASHHRQSRTLPTDPEEMAHRATRTNQPPSTDLNALLERVPAPCTTTTGPTAASAAAPPPRPTPPDPKPPPTNPRPEPTPASAPTKSTTAKSPSATADSSSTSASAAPTTANPSPPWSTTSTSPSSTPPPAKSSANSPSTPPADTNPEQQKTPKPGVQGFPMS